MSLVERVNQDLTSAMKSRDAFKTSCLRMMKSALKNREIEKKAPLADAESVLVLKTMAKQRAESVEQFEAGRRPELAEKERQEKALIESYLPAAVSPDEVEAAVLAVIRETGASGPKDTGRVMKEVMARLGAGGKMVDGKLVNESVRSKLSARAD